MSGLAVILFTECFPECNACQLKNVYLCQKIQKNEFADRWWSFYVFIC